MTEKSPDDETPDDKMVAILKAVLLAEPIAQATSPLQLPQPVISNLTPPKPQITQPQLAKSKYAAPSPPRETKPKLHAAKHPEKPPQPKSDFKRAMDSRDMTHEQWTRRIAEAEDIFGRPATKPRKPGRG